MPTKNLTSRFVETVKVEARTDFFDQMVRGLCLRVAPTGTKTWNLFYTRDSDSTKQRVKLGRFPAMTLEKARGEALKGMSSIVEGADPAGSKRARREARTVEDLGKIYIEDHAKPHKKTWKEDERLLKVEVYPAIGRMKAEAVKRRDILDILDAKAKAGYRTQSNCILSTVRKMFNWSVDNDYLVASPAVGIKPRGKPVKRERILSDEEVRLIWNALPGAKLTDKTTDIIRLLFLTGQRSGEVCGIVASEIDLEKSAWLLPPQRTKNGLSHLVPLSGDASAILRPRLNDKGDALFSRVERPIESNAIAQAVRKTLQVTGEPWTPHDIRRTVATGMANIGVMPHIIEAVLNHVSGFRGGVAGVYNRAQYEPEKRRALDMWAEHLAAVIEGRKGVVTPMRREGA